MILIINYDNYINLKVRKWKRRLLQNVNFIFEEDWCCVVCVLKFEVIVIIYN